MPYPMEDRTTEKRKTVAQRMASLIQAIKNCEESGNAEWQRRHEETLNAIVENHLPSGSGIDNGCRVHTEASHADKIVITTAFHHMSDSGMYDGWTEHVVTVTPAFNGLNIKISGQNRNDIKDYLHQVFYIALDTYCE